MSQYELWRLASEYDKNSGKFAYIMLQALKLFPSDATANINATGVMLSNGDLNTAGHCLEKAKGDTRAEATRRSATSKKRKK